MGSIWLHDAVPCIKFTQPTVIPRIAKQKLYTAEEVAWQKKNFPLMIKAGIITPCDSPWAARNKFVKKKTGELRMVQIFCPVNDATIKTNYFWPSIFHGECESLLY